MEEADKDLELRFREMHSQLGKAIRDLREHHRLSIEEAAARAGITDKRMAAIERGALPHSLTHLMHIIESLGGRMAITPEEQPTDPHIQFIEFDED